MTKTAWQEMDEFIPGYSLFARGLILLQTFEQGFLLVWSAEHRFLIIWGLLCLFFGSFLLDNMTTKED